MFTMPLLTDTNIQRYDILYKAGGANDAKFYDRNDASEKFSTTIATTTFDDIVCTHDSFIIVASDYNLYVADKKPFTSSWSTWTTPNTSDTFTSVTSNSNGRVVITYGTVAAFTDNNGSSWTTKDYGVALTGSVWANGFIYVFAGNCDYGSVDDDFTTWSSSLTTPSSPPSISTTYTDTTLFNGKIIRGSGGGALTYCTFTDLSSWTSINNVYADETNHRKTRFREYDGTLFWTMDSVDFLYSTNGTTWNRVAYSTIVVTDLLFSRGKWYIVNNAGTIYVVDGDITTSVEGDLSTWKSTGLSDSTGNGAMAIVTRVDY